MVRYIAESEDDLHTLQEPPPAAYLVLLVGGRVSQSFPLRGEVRLGRDKGNAVVLADQKVSRHHASLIPIENTFIIVDQGSANGTYLNGVLLAQPTRLKNNDRISVGDTTFIFTTSQPDPAALEQPVPALLPISLAPPVARPAAGSLISENNMSLWTLIGCMALVIISLLFIVAMLLGLFVGRSQVVGVWLLWLVQAGLG